MNWIFRITVSIFLVSMFTPIAAQVVIHSNQSPITMANESVLLELASTTKGFLPASLTRLQRDQIVNPIPGLTIYNKDTKCLEVYRREGWFNVCDNDQNQTFIAENTITANAYSDAELNTILTGYEQRRLEAFNSFKGKPRSLITSGSTFNRRHSYSYLDFAFKCLWNNEQNTAANQAIIDNCNIYLDVNGNNISNDDYYWTLDMLFAMLEYYGSNGTVAPGRITAAAEARVMEYIFYFSKVKSVTKSPSLVTYNTWNIKDSENHELQFMYAMWHASKFLKENPIYQSQTYNDGRTPLQTYDAWTTYIKQWIRERSKKGLFVEVNCDYYNAITLKGIYNFHDFGSDQEMRSLAKKLLDLFWADWSQEQYNAVHSGAKIRTYPDEMSIKDFADDALFDNTYFFKMIWFYTGKTPYKGITRHGLTMLTSSYRIPIVILDLIIDTNGKGEYEKIDMKMGQALNGAYNNSPEFLIDTSKRFIKYSYNTPKFIMGSFINPIIPQSQWIMISSQNKWAGVTFNGTSDSRLFFQCTAENSGTSYDRNYNQYWSIQKKGAIVIQKLNGTGSESTRYSKYALEMKVWIAEPGRVSQTVANDWLFVEYKEAYVAIKVLNGGYTLLPDANTSFQGNWLVLNQEYSPIIMEVVDKAKYTSFSDFQTKIVQNDLSFINNVVQYKSTYGDVLKFFAATTDLPFINGQQVNFNLNKAFNSPYLQSEWNSGIHLIKKGDRQLVLDFN
jgi:hypothetical protein